MDIRRSPFSVQSNRSFRLIQHHSRRPVHKAPKLQHILMVQVPDSLKAQVHVPGIKSKPCCDVEGYAAEQQIF